VIALHVNTDLLVLGTWSLDPIAWVLVPLLGLLYARGMARSQGSRRRTHPRWRPACYYAGLLALFLALASPLDHLADELFMAHMSQHFLLVTVAAPLLLLGAPMIPVLRGVPVGLRRELVIPVLKNRGFRGLLRFAARPLVAWPLYVALLLLWHVPGAYEAALRSVPLHLIQHAAFFGAALAWWWNVIDPVPLRPNLSYLARVPFVFITTVPIFVLGAFLTFAPSASYRFYADLPARPGLPALEDQQLGGIIMWIPGSMVLMAALLTVLVLAIRAEERQRRVSEAALPPVRMGPRR